MPTIQQSLTEPNTGADHKRLNEFLAFLATHLAAPDYATAVILPTAPSTPPSPPAATARPRDEQVARRLEEAFQNARRSNGGYGPRRVFARPRRAQPNPGHCPRLGQPHQQENTSDTPRRTIDGRPSKAFPRRPRRGPAPPRDGSERARPAVRRRAGRRRRRAAPAVRAAQRR